MIIISCQVMGGCQGHGGPGSEGSQGYGRGGGPARQWRQRRCDSIRPSHPDFVALGVITHHRCWWRQPCLFTNHEFLRVERAGLIRGDLLTAPHFNDQCLIQQIILELQPKNRNKFLRQELGNIIFIIYSAQISNRDKFQLDFQMKEKIPD